MRSKSTEEIGGNILVVDDDASSRRSLSRLLKFYDCHVLEAGSGADALDVLNQEPIDVILLDLVMSGLNGIEVCKRIRQDERFGHIPIIFVTAMDDRECRIEGKRAGGDDFLTKPVDEQELIARLQSLLARRRHFLQLEKERATLKRTVEEQSDLLCKAMVEIGKAQKNLRQFNEEIIFRLSKIVEFRDDDKGNHVQRMSRYCGLIAAKLVKSDEMAEAIRIASALHDVGKVTMPDELLRKKGKLTPDEMEFMKQHAEKGYQALTGSESSLLELAATIAYTHHERFDGNGYPRRLKGKDIPFEGRIAAVGDVFDALTSNKAYKKALGFEKAKMIIQKARGSSFDPKIVDAFFESTEDIKSIMIVYADR